MWSAPRLLLAAVVLVAAWAASAPVVLAPNPTPLGAVLLVAAATLVLVFAVPHRTAAALTGAVGVTLLVAQALVLAPPATALWGVLPTAAAACAGRARLTAAVAAVGFAAGLAAPTGTAPTPLDWSAAGVAAVWTGASLARIAMGVLAGAERRRLDACRARAAAKLAHDVGALEAVGRGLAVPHGEAGSPRVFGQGAGADHLAFATPIRGGRVFLGVLDGPPLATWTAAWILRSHACARPTDVAGLLRVATTLLDEILAGRPPQWLGVWERGTGRLSWIDAAGHIHQEERSEVVVGSAGPFGEPCHWTLPSPPAFVAPPAEPEPVPPVPWPARLALPLGAGLLLAGIASGSLAGAAGALVGLSITITAWARRRREQAKRSADAFYDVRDARAELRAELARLHQATLLPRVENGAVEAVAHRLRGERLDSTFVDVFLDRDRRLCVVAGELAGRGVLDRFMASHMGVLARVAVEEGTCFDALLPRLRTVASEETSRLFGGPARLVLGTAVLDAGGRLTAHGTLAHMVVSDGRDVTIAAEATLDECTEVYCCPATVRPGPGEIAPPVRPAAVARRAQAILAALTNTQEEGEAARPSMPALFAQIFDGVSAPASGTLIRLRRVRPARRAAA